MKDLMNNPWIYKDKPLEEKPKGFFGFVYLITDLTTDRKYVGRKYFKTLRKVKNKTNRISNESNWQDYYSSNEWILEQIKNGRPKETFRREILHLCESKGKTNFIEVEEQFKRNVLRSDEYLNHNINGKWFRANVIKY